MITCQSFYHSYFMIRTALAIYTCKNSPSCDFEYQSMPYICSNNFHLAKYKTPRDIRRIFQPQIRLSLNDWLIIYRIQWPVPCHKHGRLRLCNFEFWSSWGISLYRPTIPIVDVYRSMLGNRSYRENHSMKSSANNKKCTSSLRYEWKYPFLW
jgi:hypothetical protein